MLDYSAAGARLSHAQSVARLGKGIVLAGLRCHDPESPALERAALDGSLPGLAALRAQSLERAPAASSVPEDESPKKRRRTQTTATEPEALQVSIGLNDADVALRLIEAGAPLDEIMLAGRWHLLDHSGATVLRACEARGIAVTLAGAYASGFLAGGPNYEYRAPTPETVARRDAWAALCQSRGVDLKAAALAFCFLPNAVRKVAVGFNDAAFVDQTLDIIAQANAVPTALWRDATDAGLLPAGLLAL